MEQIERKRLPEYLKSGIAPIGEPKNKQIKNILKAYNLNTVCDSARCPNKKECYCSGSATFMIMGSACTRNCTYCNIEQKKPEKLDAEEPSNIAKAVAELKLEYCVITSVTRDDLKDGGAEHFATTIKEIKGRNPKTKVEVLTPDFKGDKSALNTVLDARPDVFNHNIETIERLYAKARQMANYRRSLELLKHSKENYPNILTKTGIMVGLGENNEELLECFKDIYQANCDILTIGQYIQPSKKHLGVEKYYTPEEFLQLKTSAEKIQIPYCVSAPLARSSYMAKEAYLSVLF